MLVAMKPCRVIYFLEVLTLAIKCGNFACVLIPLYLQIICNVCALIKVSLCRICTKNCCWPSNEQSSSFVFISGKLEGCHVIHRSMILTVA